MAKKTLDFTVDTIQSTYSPIGTVKQLDSVFFNIQITENGAVKNISNQTLKLFAKKNDSKIVEQRTDINIINASEGRVSIDLLNAALQCTGLVTFELEISDNEGTISTANFILKVQEKIANDKVIESTTEIFALKEIEDYVVQAKIEIQEFKALKDDMVETNNTINTQEAARVQAENLRIEAELNREKSLKNLNQLKTNYFGKEFDTPQERFLNEFEYLNNGEEKGSFLPFNSSKSHKVQESMEGKTRGMTLEGETLQNLLGNSGTNIELVRANNGHHRQILKDLFKQGSYYTFIPIVRLIENVDNSAFIKIVYVDSTIVYKKFKEANSSQINNICLNFEKDIKELKVELHVDNQLDAKLTLDLIALEGDWTNKEMPNYFEGIKSIGQEENKISTLSQNKNLDNEMIIESNKGRINENSGVIYKDDLLKDTVYVSDYIKIKKNTKYSYTVHNLNKNATRGIQSYAFYDINKKFISGLYNHNPIITPENAYYLRITRDTSLPFQLEEGNTETAYKSYEQDEKDILIPFGEGLKGIGSVKDEINSITNKATQRIGKYVFTGNENWVNDIGSSKDNINCYKFAIENVKIDKETICNKFKTYKKNDLYQKDVEGIIYGTNYYGGTTCVVNILKVKLPTQDVDGFKTLLRQWYAEGNPMVIYYELAEPVEYDLTQDINLNTYDDLTYISTEATSTFSAPVTISNTIARLNRENKTLEKENVKLKEETKNLTIENEYQQIDIDNNQLATVEIFEMIIGTMEISNQKINNYKVGGITMVEVYVSLIIKGKKKIEDVPAIIRTQVETMLRELGVVE